MNQEIKTRIEMIQRGKVPQGYKQTKIGIIPEDWNVDKLKSMLKIKHGKPQKDVEDINGGYPILGSGGLMGYARKYLYDKPSVLIGRKGTIDKPQFMDSPFWTVDTLFYSEINNNSNPKFIYYYFCKIPWRRYSEASGVPSLTASNIENLKVTKIDISEQEKIAKILSTWDKGIELNQEKIKEYKEYKKAFLQNIFSNKNFKEFKLKEFLTEKSERNKNNQVKRVLSVTNSRGFVNQDEYFGKGIASQDVTNYKIVKKGQFAYNPSRVNVGSIDLLSNYDEGILSPMYVIFDVKDKLNKTLFKNWLNSHNFKGRIKSFVAGSVRDSLSFKDMSMMKIRLPEDIKEQEKIAKVLQTQDKEISLLEQELEQLKLQKKSLMQLLLTGIVRVKV